MINQNPFEGIPASILVDEVMGDSYRIVKEVYCNLPSLKKIIDSEDIQYLIAHFDELQKVVAITDELKVIASKIDVIIKSPEYAESAKNDALLSKDWAIKLDNKVNGEDYSSKWYANESKSKYLEVKRLYELVTRASAVVEPIADQIKLLARNINAINTTATNINGINTVATDLTSTKYIETASKNIKVFQDATTNLDVIKEAIKTKEELQQKVNEANTVLEQVTTDIATLTSLRDSASTLLDDAKKEISKVTNEGTKQINTIKSTGTSWNTTITQNADSKLETYNQNATNKESVINQKAREVATNTQLVNSAKESVNTSVGTISRIQEEINATKENIDSISDTISISAQSVQSNLDESNRVKREVNTLKSETNQIKTDVSEIKQEVLDTQIDINKNVSATANQLKEAKEQVTIANNAVNSIGNSVKRAEDAALEATTANENITSLKEEINQLESSTRTNASTASTRAKEANQHATTAFNEAERAKGYADNASSGQINSDWNELDSLSKAFIRNKPVLAPVATSGSYNDLVDKPTIVKTTWDNIEGKPETFTPSVHKHEVSDITNLQSQLDAKQPVGNYATKGELPTDNKNLTNGAGYITSSALTPYAKSENVNQQLNSINATLINKVDKSQLANLATKEELGNKLDKLAKAESAKEADKVLWENIPNKPEQFTPISHRHKVSEIDGLQDQTNSKVQKEHFTESQWISSGSEFSITLAVSDVFNVYMTDSEGATEIACKITSLGNSVKLTALSAFTGYALVASKQTIASTSVSWEDIQGKPSSFTPSSHKHTITEINNLQQKLNSKVNISSIENKNGGIVAFGNDGSITFPNGYKILIEV